MISRALSLPGGRFAVPQNRWDLVPATAPAREPELSVVVPYYRARAQLDLVLEALALQDYPAGRFEVIVADDGSPEPLRLDRPAGSAGPRTRVVRQDDRGFRAAAARNLAAGVAEGELLCFLDQDTVPEPGYLRALTRLPALLPDALVVGRRRHADLTGWTPRRLRDWLTGAGEPAHEFPAPAWLEDAYRDSRNLLDCDQRSYRFIISAVMCCTMALFTELGGFDESFTSYGGEDWELAYRAWNAGAVLAHEPRAVAWHDGPDWAGRGDTAEREAVKAAEIAALARLIPAPDRPADPADPDAPAELALTWTGTAALPAGHLAATVADLLSAPINLALYLDPGETGRCTGLQPRDRPLPMDRLRTGPVGADVLARARHRVTVTDPATPTPDLLATLRAQLDSGHAGRVQHSGPPGSPELSAWSQRAVRRAARHRPDLPGRDLVDDLFGSLRFDSLQVRRGDADRDVTSADAVLRAGSAVGRVLIVDDDPDTRRLLEVRIAGMGHQVLSAGSAVEALQAFDEHGVPEVAILDVVMPDITGLELLEHLRRDSTYARMPAIFLTARALDEDVAEAQALHAIYLNKPIVAATLSAAIDQALALGAPPD